MDLSPSESTKIVYKIRFAQYFFEEYDSFEKAQETADQWNTNISNVLNTKGKEFYPSVDFSGLISKGYKFQVENPFDNYNK
jgi:hypothetical protein